MNYIIEMDVVFSPAEKTLSLYNEHSNSVVLSNQANRLLLEMVTSKNELLYREELVRRVWEDYGFTSSNNSLNVAVSELRKAFSSLGKDPQVISTVPKAGFIFEGVVVPAATNSQPSNSNAETEQNNRQHTKVKWKSIVFLLIVMIAVSFLVAIYTSKKVELKTNEAFKKFAFIEDKCTVYTLGHQLYTSDEIKKDIERILDMCKTNKMDIFYEKTTSSGLFVGACTKNNKNKYLRCNTIKQQAGVMQ
ncbi:TPA: winged helix-turn-helix domain-containing protein [Enterobacter cloacae]|nr:winged helix-turn-helix domain-containing protein [Enterobacter cloacae]